MVFNSVDFLIFFPIVVLLYFLLPRKCRWVWLLAASYYFYMCWNAKYAVLMAASTVITYLSGRLITRANAIADEKKRTRLRKLWVGLSVGMNLAILCFFKYLGFLTQNLGAFLGAFGVQLRAPAWDIVLPVGISFYTFQALSYTIDVYRGEIQAEKNLFRYALFVSFFPQLVAGPIERSSNLLTQVQQSHDFDADRVRDGLLLMLWGMVQKVVLADRLAIAVDTVFANWTQAPGWAILAAVVLFAVQIYCDFGGYSSIAIGAAQVLGFRLMDNFRQPYFSRSCGEFWRRWHISLSSWFRDYLYIPLGGNRRGKGRKYLNVLLTFTASGLWHGARWSYVAWGAMNGVFQIIGAQTESIRKKLCSALHISRERLPWRLVQIAVTFVCIDFSWLFFRASSFRTAVKMLFFALRGGAVQGAGGVAVFGLGTAEMIVLLAGVGLLFAVDLLHEKYKSDLRPLITAQPLPLRWLIYLVGIYIVLIFGVYGPGFSEAQFIYFQF